jgi:hypothetical protein
MRACPLRRSPRSVRALGRCDRARRMRGRPLGRQTLVVGERIDDFCAGGIILGARRGAAQRGQSGKAKDEADMYLMSRASPHPYPRKAAPVFLATSATILAIAASICASVKVPSRGCSITAIATDLWPPGTPCPS